MYACSKVLSVYPPLRFGFGSWLFPPRSRSITSPLWRMNVGSSISNRSVSVVGMIFSRGYNSATLPLSMAKRRSEEHTSELQSLMRISYAVFCLEKKRESKTNNKIPTCNREIDTRQHKNRYESQ